VVTMVTRNAAAGLFWGVGIVLAAFVGPAQAASRSFLARVTPAGREGEVFGLYATTGRAAGTLFIIGVGAAAGLGLGLIRGARYAGRSRSWRAWALLAFPVVMAPQGIAAFLPAFLLGGLAISGRPALWIRVLLASLTATAPWLFLFVLMGPGDRIGVPVLVFVAGLYVLQLGLAVGGLQLFRRWPPRTTIASSTSGSARLAVR